MDLYRNGIIGKLAEYAAKKYRSIEYIFHKLNNMKLFNFLFDLIIILFLLLFLTNFKLL